MLGFDIIFKLILVALIPVVASVGVRCLEKYTRFGLIKRIYRQIGYGILFGIISALATVLCGQIAKGASIEVRGAIPNVRDAAPICAGLIFGGPAGIIAGIIGGVHRFISVYWGGSGAYTQIACSVSTVIAGIITTIVRKYVFDGHHGTWFYGLGLGLLIEDFHMLMVFFTHMDDVRSAYETVKLCAVPMIIANSLAVMLAVIGVAIVSKEKLIKVLKPHRLSSIVQVGIFVSLLLAYLTISFFTYFSISNIIDTSTTTLLESSVDDVRYTVDDEIDRIIYEKLQTAKQSIESNIDSSSNIDVLISGVKDSLGVTEVILIDENGIIAYDTLSIQVGYNMSDGEQSKVFNVLLTDSDKYIIQDLQTNSYSGTRMKYGGISIVDNSKNIGYIQIAYNTADYHNLIDNNIKYATDYRHVGTSGFVTVFTDYGVSLTDNEYLNVGDQLDLSNLKFNSKNVYTYKRGDVSADLYYYAKEVEGYYIIALADKAECDLDLNISFLSTTLTEVFIFLSMYCFIYILVKRTVVNKITEINRSLYKISEGNLNVVVNSRDTAEFNSLSDDINKTVNTLKGFIDREARKNEQELNLAKNIQHSALPQTFPPFPTYTEFDIYATMDTAKEVGGDFYDFFLLSDRKLAILVADVSGKGIPAAMFMMQSKTIIKGLSETGLSVDKVFTETNKRLCQGNDAQMFVTAWLGFIDLDTGEVNYVNAGHNPPLVMHDGKFEYLKSRPGFVLAGFDGFNYREQSFTLSPKDQIFLYTDGVTEATSRDVKLYGEERLLQLVNKNNNIGAKDLCETILKDIDVFTEGAEQSDDITMLSFQFYGKRNIKDITLKATVENVSVVSEFVESFLEANDCSMKLINQINIIIDEIFSNIAFYSYPKDQIGDAKVTIEKRDDAIYLAFEDYGITYNPLEKEDPNIKLSAEERQIGGLGIFMVKNLVDDISYNNINGRNVLKVKKNIK